MVTVRGVCEGYIRGNIQTHSNRLTLKVVGVLLEFFPRFRRHRLL